MNWIKMEDFDYSRTGEVIMVMKDKKGNNIVREDSLSKSIYKDEDPRKIFVKDIERRNYVVVERDGYFEMFRFSRASIKNVIAFVFKNEIINDCLNNI